MKSVATRCFAYWQFAARFTVTKCLLTFYSCNSLQFIVFKRLHTGCVQWHIVYLRPLALPPLASALFVYCVLIYICSSSLWSKWQLSEVSYLLVTNILYTFLLIVCHFSVFIIDFVIKRYGTTTSCVSLSFCLNFQFSETFGTAVYHEENCHWSYMDR